MGKLVDEKKIHIVTDGWAISLDIAHFGMERSGKPDGIYIGERLADAPEAKVFGAMWESTIQGIPLSAEAFCKGVIAKKDKGKLPLMGLSKMTKGFATQLGDEGMLFAKEPDCWELLAFGVRRKYVDLLEPYYSLMIMLSPALIYPITTFNEPMQMGVSGNMAVITTENAILICGTVDINKRLELLAS